MARGNSLSLLNAPRQCSLVLPVKVGLRGRETLVSEGGKALLNPYYMNVPFSNACRKENILIF